MMGGFILLAVMVAVYFLPTLIAMDKKNATQVFVVNLFLGFTFVGWVVALVMAVKNEDK